MRDAWEEGSCKLQAPSHKLKRGKAAGGGEMARHAGLQRPAA